MYILAMYICTCVRLLTSIHSEITYWFVNFQKLLILGWNGEGCLQPGTLGQSGLRFCTRAEEWCCLGPKVRAGDTWDTLAVPGSDTCQAGTLTSYYFLLMLIAAIMFILSLQTRLRLLWGPPWRPGQLRLCESQRSRS